MIQQIVQSIFPESKSSYEDGTLIIDVTKEDLIRVRESIYAGNLGNSI